MHNPPSHPTSPISLEHSEFMIPLDKLISMPVLQATLIHRMYYSCSAVGGTMSHH